jgi:hypothetical protein
MYVLEADSVEELLNDWNGECNAVPENDAKVYLAMCNGNVINPDMYTDFQSLLSVLRALYLIRCFAN